MADLDTTATTPGASPRIFQIGFNKCGTRTIHNFLDGSGIPSVHYRRGTLAKIMHKNIQEGRPPLYYLDKWIGYTDIQMVSRFRVIEGCKFYRELAAYYPASYFILNTRDKDRWIKSRLEHGGKKLYSNRYRKGLGFNTIDEAVAVWSDDWDRHHDEVPEFFERNGLNLVVYDIEQDSPEKLVEFLAPDFQTDAKHFGHAGKSIPADDESEA
ncbi:MAG: sulfotransferase [Pseudomonadota bacterium]